MPNAKGLEFSCEKDSDSEPEHILKALSSLSTPEEKLAALCKKYADLHEDHRILKNKFKSSQKSLTTLMREKDQLQTEHSKSILAKSKLESLCRELQRHNKLVKEESLARAREEEEKRKEVTGKFQTTINDIQTQMNDHYSKNTKLREENLELATKLKTLMEQYETREQHIEKLFKHKELEQQLVDAKLAQSNLVVMEEKEKSNKEKQLLLQQAADAQKKIILLEEQEKQLRAQVAIYTEKYEEFQQTLAKSNDVFQSFKSEMDKMTKKIKKLEKETTMWRQRWETCNKNLIEMAEEKTRTDRERGQFTAKIGKLESLCRALQQERNKDPTDKGSKPLDIKVADGAKTPPNTPDNSSQTTPDSEQAPDPAAEPQESQSQPSIQTESSGQSEEALQKPDDRPQTEGSENCVAVEAT